MADNWWDAAPVAEEADTSKGNWWDSAPVADERSPEPTRDAPVAPKEEPPSRTRRFFDALGLSNNAPPTDAPDYGGANAMGDFYDPAGGTEIAGKIASKFVAPVVSAPAESLSLAGRAAKAGAVQSVQDVSQTLEGPSGLKDAKPHTTGDQQLDKLLETRIGEGWNDPNWWIAKTVQGLTASSPVVAGMLVGGAGGAQLGGVPGALAGSAVGAAGGSVLQTLGPAYVRALAEGKSEDDAFNQAWKETAISASFAAVMGVAPGYAAWGKTAEGALKAPVKEALLQLLAVQPGLMVGQKVTTDLATGRKTTGEDLLETGVLGAVTGVGMVAGHRAVTPNRAKATPAPEPTPELGPDATQAAATGPASAPAAPEAPVTAPAAPAAAAGLTPEQIAQVQAVVQKTAPPATAPKGAGTGNAAPPPVVPGVGDPNANPTGSATNYPKAEQAKKVGKARAKIGKVNGPVDETQAAALAPAPGVVPAEMASKLQGLDLRTPAEQLSGLNQDAPAAPVTPVTPEVTQVAPVPEPAPAPAPAPTPVAPPNAGAVQRTTGYEGPNPDVIYNRIDHLERFASDESKPEKQRREALSRVDGFRKYLERREASFEEAGLPEEQRAQIRGLKPGDIVTGKTRKGEVVTGEIDGWGYDGRIGIKDENGFNADILPDSVTDIRGGAGASVGGSGLSRQEPGPPMTKSEAPAPIKDTTTVPETMETLREQQKKLEAGAVAAVLFPVDPQTGKVKELPVVKGTRRVNVYDGEGDLVGVMHYRDAGSTKREDIKTTTAAELKAATKEGRINEVLYPESKSKTEAVADAAAKSEDVVAVTERTPEGTEVKSVGTNESDAPRQAKALKKDAAAKNVVAVEPVAKVLADRVKPEANSEPKIPFADARKFLPKDAKGSTDYDALNKVTSEVAGEAKPWDALSADQQRAVVDKLRADAPEAPANATPVVAEKVKAAKARAKKSAAPKAEAKAEPAPEPAKVEAKAEPEAPRQSRILRPVEEERAIAAANEAVSRGYRGQDDGVAPNYNDPKATATEKKNARKRFLTRASAAVKELGDQAPQYYRDAIESKKAETSADQKQQLRTAWDAEWAAEQAGTPKFAVTGKVKGEVAKVEEKVNSQEAKAEQDATKPEDDTVYTPRSKVTDEDTAAVMKAFPELSQVNDPDRLAGIIAALKDQVRSKKTDGVFDGERSTGALEFRDEVTKDTTFMSPEAALIEKQRQERLAKGLDDDEPPAALPMVRTSQPKKSNAAIEAIKQQAAERAKARQEPGTSEVKSYKPTPQEAERILLAMEANKAKATLAQADRDQEVIRRSLGLESGGQSDKTSWIDRLESMLGSSNAELQRLANKLNRMDAEQFGDWLVRASRDERVAARMAQDNGNVIRHFDVPTAEYERNVVRAAGRFIKSVIDSSPSEKLSAVMPGLLTEAGSMGNIPRGIVRLLHDRILRVVGDMDVHFATDAQMRDLAKMANGANSDGSLGTYFWGENKIVLNGSRMELMTGPERYNLAFHESFHGALANMLERPQFKEFRTLVDNLRTTVKDRIGAYLDRDTAYGLTDAHEFLSELRNPDFIEALGAVRFTPAEVRSMGFDANTFKGRVVSALNVLVESVRRALRLQDSSQVTSALELAFKLADKGLALRESLGEGARYSRQEGDSVGASNAPIKDPEARFTRELKARGVDPVVAAQIAKIMVTGLGPKPTLKAAMPLIKQFGLQYGTALQGRPGGAKSVAIQQAQAQRRAATSQGNAPAPAAIPGVGPKGRNIMQKVAAKIGETSVGERTREELIDYNRPVQRFDERNQERLGRTLSDNEAVYEQKRLLEPKVTGALRRLEVGPMREIEGALKEGKKLDVGIDEMGQWLTARHAEERNLEMQSRDPKMTAGSGMSTADANAILSAVAADPKKQALFDRVAKINDDLRNFTLDKLLEGRRMSQAQVDALRNMYKKYTSLKGFEDDAIAKAVGVNDFSGGGAGMSVFGKDVRKAEGRVTLSDNPIHNMLQNAVVAIERAERNKVLVNAAETLRKTGFTKEEAGVFVAENVAATPGKNLAAAVHDGRVLGFKEDGVDKFLVFSDKRQAEAFQRLSPDNLHFALDKMVNFLNKVKNLWTHYSPEFIVRHFAFRYPIEGMMNLKGMKEQGLDTGALRYLKDAFTSVPDVNRYLQGNKVKNPKIAQYIREMEENGGVVSFRNVSDTLDVKQRAERVSLGKHSKLGELHEAWDRTLTAMDAGQRLATYVRAREAGMSPQKAAIMSRDATVDFARKGKSAGLLSVWSAFGNVAIQTTARMGRAFGDSKSYRRTIYGIMGAAAAIELANYMLGGNDEDGTPWIEKIPSYERIQNVVLFVPGSNDKGMPHYIKVPLPYPLFGIWPTGSAMTQTMLSQLGMTKLKPGEVASRVGHGMAETLTPFGRNVNNLSTLTTPEAVRWLAELGENRDWKGDAIHTEFPKKAVPKSEQARTGTAEGWQTMARGLAKIGLDFYPEDIKHVTDQYIGAQRRFVNGILTTGEDTAKGDVNPNKIPGARLVYGEVDRAKSDRSRMFNLENKGAVSPETLRALRSSEYGNANATQKVLIQAAERRSGMTAKQLLAVNAMVGEVKKYDKEVRSVPQGTPKREAAEKRRSEFLAKKMKELNDLGVKGGIDRHGG